MDVYAPLAHRFGIARIKWELEDLAFKVLQPERYFEVEAGINQTRAERERLIEKIVDAPAARPWTRPASRAEIGGRPKHFYSIYRKMQAQEIGLDRVYDLLALRIIVETKADCYHALGVLHSQFPPLADRIKDYIATPKPNMYQSHPLDGAGARRQVHRGADPHRGDARAGRAGHRRPLALQGGRRRRPGRPGRDGQVAAPDHGVAGGRGRRRASSWKP